MSPNPKIRKKKLLESENFWLNPVKLNYGYDHKKKFDKIIKKNLMWLEQDDNDIITTKQNK